MRILQLRLTFLREEHIWQVGKEIIPRWKPLNQPQIPEWSLILLKTISLELSICRTSGAKEKIADALPNAMEKIKLHNRVFFTVLFVKISYVVAVVWLNLPPSWQNKNLITKTNGNKMYYRCYYYIIVRYYSIITTTKMYLCYYITLHNNSVIT